MPKHGTVGNPHNEPGKPGYNPELEGGELNTFGYARGGEVGYPSSIMGGTARAKYDELTPRNQERLSGEDPKERVTLMLEVAKTILSEGQSVPKELSEQILKINPADWSGGFFGFGYGGETFAEEIDEIQRVLRGGNYSGKGLLLKEGQTPADHLLKYYPKREGMQAGGSTSDLDRLGVKYDQDDPMRQVVGASIKLINEFMPEIDKELKMAFLQGDLQTKTQLLQEHANDTDDRLWRSNEWMFLERALGEGTPDDIYDRSMEGKQGGGLDSFGYGTTRG